LHWARRDACVPCCTITPEMAFLDIVGQTGLTPCGGNGSAGCFYIHPGAADPSRAGQQT
jgi:hypothetical protein